MIAITNMKARYSICEEEEKYLVYLEIYNE